MTYSEKLRDPRWQKKRLKILERAGWKCQCCKDSKNTLNVHHLVYTGKDPWDEPDSNLEVLCEDCHEWREDWNRYMEGRSVRSTMFCQAFYAQICVPVFTGDNEGSHLESQKSLVRWLMRWVGIEEKVPVQKESPIRGVEPGIEQQPRVESTYHTSSV